jgi:tripartite ATP-independent transporter DctM subunit
MYWLNKVIRILDKVGVFSRWTNIVGLALFSLMVIVTFVDVFLRYIFSRPLAGVAEVAEVLLIAAVFLAIAHTQNEKSHISIDLITAKLAPKARIVIEFVTHLLGLGMFVIIVWRTLEQTILFVQDHRIHSQYIMIPSAPFAAIIVLGCTALSLLLLRDLLSNVAEALRLGLRWYRWLLMLGIPIIFIVLAILWMQPTLWQMSLTTVGLIGVIFSLLLFLSGMPVAFALILTSFMFVSHIRGLDTGLDMAGLALYSNTGSYSWAVIAFFVLMGFFSLSAGFAEDLYYAAYRWVGHMRGGLAIATIGASTAFASIVGDGVSATATIGTVSLPQMRKYKYDDHLSTGSIVSGSSLGPIIPPSVLFIIYGLLAQVSIGKLLVAGIIPGLLLGASYMLVVYGWCRYNPSLGAAGERAKWGQRVVSLKAGGPVAFLFLLVIGGIYAGIFTPSEGGAIGAAGAIILSLVMRRFTWKSFVQSLLGGGKVIALTFLILNGGLMFGRFAAWCNLSGATIELITGLGLSTLSVMLLILLIILILGFFTDILPLIMIGVPILHPVAVAQGVDPIWFAVLMVMTINLGTITPPVGIGLFTLKGVAKDIPIGTIFSGVLPFTLATIVIIVIIIAVPAIATWLPGLMK